jgi:hypothetical protein
MAIPAQVVRMLALEARALQTRLARVKPFALQDASLPAASLLPEAQNAIEHLLARGRRDLKANIEQFLHWLDSPASRAVDAEYAHRRLVFLRLRFNMVLNQFDMFIDVLTQRSESETGVWLSGLDVVSADALDLPGGYYRAPPVITYLDRGIGAAIRRARTRLPGGAENPVAVVRVPRERMISHGIASSLIHEVGHQAAALLDLVNSLRPVLKGLQTNAGRSTIAWQLWERWISEILADLWSVARIGVASTLGLMGVVGLPRPFMFRINVDDPHPAPWIRVKLSCAIGQALYPHPQWNRLSAIWDAYYPLSGLDQKRQELLTLLENHLPAFVSLLTNHRPASLRGRSLAEVLKVNERQPLRLQRLERIWRRSPGYMYRASPSLVFAVLGQARADDSLSPEDESELLGKLLSHWALRSTLNVSAACVQHRGNEKQQQPSLNIN